jgi:hypothetical protein
VVGPEAKPSGKPHPLVTFDPLHPQRISIAPHSGVPGLGFSMHCPFEAQFPIGKKHEAPDGHDPSA